MCHLSSPPASDASSSGSHKGREYDTNMESNSDSGTPDIRRSDGLCNRSQSDGALLTSVLMHSQLSKSTARDGSAHRPGSLNASSFEAMTPYSGCHCSGPWVPQDRMLRHSATIVSASLNRCHLGAQNRPVSTRLRASAGSKRAQRKVSSSPAESFSAATSSRRESRIAERERSVPEVTETVAASPHKNDRASSLCASSARLSNHASTSAPTAGSYSRRPNLAPKSSATTGPTVGRDDGKAGRLPPPEAPASSATAARPTAGSGEEEAGGAVSESRTGTPDPTPFPDNVATEPHTPIQS